MRYPYLVLTVVGLGVVAVLAWQQRNLNQLRTQLAEVTATRAVAVDLRSAEPAPPAAEPVAVVTDGGADGRGDAWLEQRVATLETAVARLNQNSDHLMDRGAVPPTEAKLAEWEARFLDPTVSGRDRLSALRLLRRNDVFSPAMAQGVLAWLNTSPEAQETRQLLDALRGVDDPSLRTAILDLATASTDARVRESALRNLRSHVDDPAVETALWDIATSDPSDRVRRRARSSLEGLPMDDSRVANLEQRILNPSTSLDEQLVALRLLDEGEQDITSVAAALAVAAGAATDRDTRLAYYEAFDEVNDPNFMLPLIEGLEDPDAEVRLRATDALIDYRSEPTISDLLKAIAETDPNPRVREEAARVFRSDRR